MNSRCRILPLLALSIPLAAQVPNPIPSNPSEIEVDQYCRIASVDLRDPTRPRVQHKYIGGICRLDGAVSHSINYETTIRNGVGKEVAYEVVEREFLLHNPYPRPITFIVKDRLRKKYHVNSDPQPAEVVGSLATFRVQAEPNQTVRLHVGERN